MLRYCEQFLLRTVFVSALIAAPLISQRADTAEFRRHLSVLADDSLEGRGTGSRGCEQAAEYLRHTLRSYGIQPPAAHSDYSQTFPLHGSRPVEGTEFKLYAPKDSYSLRLQEDYVLYSAGEQTFIPSPVKLIFVGYGIVAPEYDYNDYQNTDVTNAIVIFLSGEPSSEDDAYFDGERTTVHSSFVMKQKTALARGARGSILIPAPSDRTFDDWYEQQRHFLFEEVRPLLSPSENFNVLMNPKLVPFLFTDSPYSYDDIAQFEREHTMKSFPLTLRASFQGRFREREFLTSNVIGIIEGNDPALKDSYLLLSAHYDHLGIGTAVDGDSLYNGAFDNASGTAALLEIARMMKMSGLRPKRTVVFLFVTGEERGFIGSQYYCLNPVFPIHKTIANINIDGLSLFEPVSSFIGVGAELSSLGVSLDTVLERRGLRSDAIPDGPFRPDQFRNSDQYMFAQAGIPSILIAEGLHYETTPFEEGLKRYTAWTEERYHTPFDDLSQAFDLRAAAQHIAVILDLAVDLANTHSLPKWNEWSPFLLAQKRNAVEKR
jgi:hypothetical protein